MPHPLRLIIILVLVMKEALLYKLFELRKYRCHQQTATSPFLRRSVLRTGHEPALPPASPSGFPENISGS
jgi:hypothetical protein